MAADASPKFLSQADFARRRGVSRKAVTGWKSKGLLVLNEDGKVDVEATEWKLDDRPANYRGGVTHRPIRAQDGNNSTHAQSVPKQKSPSGNKPLAPRPADGAPDPADFDLDDPNLPMAEAVRRKENFLGLLRKHELAVARGLYVRKADVVTHIARAFVGFRQAVQRMPSRHVAESAARLGVDPGALEVELDRMIHATLAEMSAPALRG